MHFAAWAMLMFALLDGGLAGAVQDPTPSFTSLSTQAQAARDSHQLEKAFELYAQALNLKPDWEDGLWSLGSIAYDLDRYSDCARAFQKLSEVKPNGVPGWTMRGLCEYKLRDYGAALDSL